VAAVRNDVQHIAHRLIRALENIFIRSFFNFDMRYYCFVSFAKIC
jgi:hypothetical protein